MNNAQKVALHDATGFYIGQLIGSITTSNQCTYLVQIGPKTYFVLSTRVLPCFNLN
jgi:hypothetical protein